MLAVRLTHVMCTARRGMLVRRRSTTLAEDGLHLVCSNGPPTRCPVLTRRRRYAPTRLLCEARYGGRVGCYALAARVLAY
eukprot:3933969-Rhodomonas_salina.3